MAGRVRLDAAARDDFDEYARYLARTIEDDLIVARQLARLNRDLKKLAETPMLDRADPDLVENDKQFYWQYVGGSKGRDFKVYFERLAPKTIFVIRLWPSRREPLAPSEILKNVLKQY